MKNDQKNPDIMTGNLTASDLLDKALICISRPIYDELIRAEEQREILFHAYQQMNHYDLEKVLEAVFNPKFKYQKNSDA